jgi:hypothetical protein
VDVVPKIQMGTQGGASVIENLLALMMTEKLGQSLGVAAPVAISPQAEAVRAELRKGMNGGTVAR